MPATVRDTYLRAHFFPREEINASFARQNSTAGQNNLQANYFFAGECERILEKCAKTNACVWSEAEAAALKSPACRTAGHTHIFMKTAKKRIF